MSAPSYPYEALPGLLRGVLEERSQHKKDDALSASILEAISSLLASGIAVGERPDGGTMPLASYGLVLGSSGIGKSFHERPLSAPIINWIAGFKENYQKEVNAFKADHLIWKKRTKLIENAIEDGLKGGEDISSTRRLLMEAHEYEPKIPIEQKLFHDDAQIQSVLRAFEHWRISAWMSDEGMTILSKLRQNDFHVLANLWEGKTIRHERVGEPYRELKGFLTMLLMVQPDRFNTYMRKHGDAWRGSGLSARLLYYPVPDEWLGAEDPDYAYFGDAYKQYVDTVTNLLQEIHTKSKKGDSRLETVSLGDKAKRVFSGIRDHYRELAFSKQYEHCREFLAKLPGHVSRMAIKNHVFLGKSGSVSVELLERADEVCGYHLDACKWVSDPVIEQPQRVRDAVFLGDWLRERRLFGFQYKKLGQLALVTGLTSARLRSAIGVMCELGQAHLVKKEGEMYVDVRLAFPNLNSILDSNPRALY